MNYHGFDRELAIEIGLEAAIIFRVIAGKVITKLKHSDCQWIELSIDNIVLVCPYISKYQVRKCVNALIEHGLIVVKLTGEGRCRAFTLSALGHEQFNENSKSTFKNSESNLTGTKSNLTGTKSNLTGTKSNLTDAKSSFPSSIDQLDQLKENTHAHAHANTPIQFAMQDDWQPRDGFLSQAAMAGAVTTPDRLAQLIVQFRLANASGQIKTQSQWESILISWIRNESNKTAQRSITGAPPRNKYQQSRSAMEGFLND